MSRHLAFDLGASSGRGILGDLDILLTGNSGSISSPSPVSQVYRNNDCLPECVSTFSGETPIGIHTNVSVTLNSGDPGTVCALKRNVWPGLSQDAGEFQIVWVISATGSLYDLNLKLAVFCTAPNIRVLPRAFFCEVVATFFLVSRLNRPLAELARGVLEHGHGAIEAFGWDMLLLAAAMRQARPSFSATRPPRLQRTPSVSRPARCTAPKLLSESVARPELAASSSCPASGPRSASDPAAGGCSR